MLILIIKDIHGKFPKIFQFDGNENLDTKMLIGRRIEDISGPSIDGHFVITLGNKSK